MQMTLDLPIAEGHLCNMGKMIEEMEGKLRNSLDQVIVSFTSLYQPGLLNHEYLSRTFIRSIFEILLCIFFLDRYILGRQGRWSAP